MAQTQSGIAQQNITHAAGLEQKNTAANMTSKSLNQVHSPNITPTGETTCQPGFFELSGSHADNFYKYEDGMIVAIKRNFQANMVQSGFDSALAESMACLVLHSRT